MTLQALREKIDDDATFFGLLGAWYTENKSDSVTTDKSVTTEDFIALAKREIDQLTDQQLDNFFQVWLYEEGKPALGSW